MKKDNSAVWDTSLPISTKAIAIAMAEHVGASQAQLARYASCSDRLIRKALKQLIEHGLIEQVPAKNCSFVPRNQGDVYMPTWLDPSESLNRNNEPELCAGLAVNRNNEPAHSSGLDLAQESQHARGSLFSSYEENKEHTKGQQQPRAHTREGILDEQSKSKSVRPVVDDTRGHSRGDDPHGSAHPLPDVHPSADARGSDAPSSTHRAEDEGRLTPDRRYRIAYDLAQFVLAANEDRPVGQQLGASFTMLEPAMLSFVKHVEARVSSERVEDVAGQCIRAVVHAERLKFLEMWAREALDDVLAEKAPAVSRAPRRAPSSSRLPQPGSSFEEEDDWSAKYKRAFDLAKEAQQ